MSTEAAVRTSLQHSAYILRAHPRGKTLSVITTTEEQKRNYNQIALISDLVLHLLSSAFALHPSPFQKMGREKKVKFQEAKWALTNSFANNLGPAEIWYMSKVRFGAVFDVICLCYIHRLWLSGSGVKGWEKTGICPLGAKMCLFLLKLSCSRLTASKARKGLFWKVPQPHVHTHTHTGFISFYEEHKYVILGSNVVYQWNCLRVQGAGF